MVRVSETSPMPRLLCRLIQTKAACGTISSSDAISSGGHRKNRHRITPAGWASLTFGSLEQNRVLAAPSERDLRATIESRRPLRSLHDQFRAVIAPHQVLHDISEKLPLLD